ncbi:rod shape-determining protein RodA [Heliophilum fasciatum]|uniref:Peptidoglycan glycosyltransferase RodA n=1 Tax=Heliophilum fasciatum TaxID=35700 RepID=A0A4R2RV20_9FIRM|nr:rod shape-determining protein RodA [Heliophilum fasciatum]MCW2277133.1 rod shape determining protein RodA [Heliophilum fasciatum]TCP68230.1 rod shape determining protein RodA [Heliophilum fasciatum]
MDLKRIKNIDVTLLVSVFLLLTFSLIILSSASSNVGREPLDFVRKQATWMLIGITLAGSFLFVQYQTMARFSWYIYAANLLLLMTVFFIGINVNGAVRWVNIGAFQFQPSEFSKLIMIVTFADFLARRQGQLNTLKELLPCFAYVAVPMLLILKQPDLGTSLVLIAIMIGMMYAAGANKRILTSLITGGLVVIVFSLYAHFQWGLPLPLQEYQINRLIIFINPDLDPVRTGYHIRQSLIAIGSGGLFGKGLFNGTQAQLNFLPEHHTDFIFSVVGEELGFAGVFGLLLLFFILIVRGLRIARDARDIYGSLLVIGILSMFLFHIMINVGMTIGIMPVTGIPLPFVSYGGSAMITNMACIGILLNVNLRRRTILF